MEEVKKEATVSAMGKEKRVIHVNSIDLKLERMNREEAILYLKGRLDESYARNRELLVANHNLRQQLLEMVETKPLVY
ncbi:hypothetical protein P9E76_01750 [Schinkia azotoformans]|uniref:Uncharacterized protein n=1 Tax=Schinkia azotoformans LMG 9581 TaxID=1131731 RepID=K6D5N6_SCHAZ|nr:hypothetical protein [Schinkia azotoformans]EKN67837.1 hypothetical protein BAZO_08144 [Schinkia azotoformans LMG 9581]MEC1637398.1 hypothetical protein [Schinkia azotoformans]MEC1943802.1 hypothetical protein [Schinkia azotoformans]